MFQISTAIFAFCFVAAIVLFALMDAALRKWVSPRLISWFTGNRAGAGSSASRLRIGVIGFSGSKFDEAKASKAVSACFDRLSRAAEATQSEIEIVSGLTALGVPKLAYQEAARRGWKTAGIACARAREHPCFPCDSVRIVGEQWGDESPTFLKGIDVLVRIGGGAQAKSEYEQFGQLKMWYDLDTEDPTKPVEILNVEDEKSK